MISVAVTHHERYELLLEALALPLRHPDVDEIIISDDHSQDGSWLRILETFVGHEPKVTLHRNPERIDCYANKAQALRTCNGEWAILLDSDNQLTEEYLEAIPEQRDPHTWYLPTFAQPEFDYRAFAGLTIDRGNVAEHVDRPMFLTALNTANHVVHRDTYLRVWNPDATPVTADSIYMSYRWLRAGYRLHFVDGMAYHHRMHDGSHFRLNHNDTHEAFKLDIDDRLRRMR